MGGDYLRKVKTWVCRRLSLLFALPEQIVELARSGHLSGSKWPELKPGGFLLATRRKLLESKSHLK
jgi:hypothetical protein